MLTCIAVEDEPLALDLLEDNIRQIPFLHLVKRCKNAFEAAEVLQNESVDLIFLDIQMPGLTGLQFLKTLPSSPMIIFITAYKNYALEGFELGVIDYLLKPISFERFMKAVNKAVEYSNLKNSQLANFTSEYLFVYSEYNLVKIFVSEIKYIEGMKDYIKIYLSNSDKPIITRLSIKTMEEKLPSNKFVRTHKSFVVAIDRIQSLRNSRIKLDTIEVPLSDHYKEHFFKLVGPKIILS
ncbi:MAG: response regulator transcription factor [Bacteroidetes bacterium]|nr:response regulator transcription factor [Bacteroidota bacterium]MBL0033697.1 response regulator transcription factor [Bacteroidota bacterium]